MRPTLLLIVMVLALALIRPAIPVHGADPVINLHGRIFAPQGWGFASSSIASPGPLIQVSAGATVTLNLYSDDSVAHTFFIDYNGNGVPDPGEPLSSPFSSPTTPLVFSFTASVAGSFTYWCSIHNGPMFGPWQTLGSPPPNTPPSASFSSPLPGVSFSGGSQHTLTWTMTDAQDPSANLRVWLNLTVGSTTSPLISDQKGVTTYVWLVPFANATATLHLDVKDTQGAVGSAQTTLTIDSTHPQVKPAGIAYASQMVTVTFSEPMAPSASPHDIAVQDLNTSAWAPGTLSWGSGNTVATFAPVSVLEPGHTFRVYVNGTLRDASDPGNSLAQAATFDFTIPRSNPPPTSGAFDAGLWIIPSVAIASALVLALLFLARRRSRSK